MAGLLSMHGLGSLMNQSAATGLDGGLEEMLTLSRLGPAEEFRRSDLRPRT
jgi:hypothetical protein